MTTVYAIDGRRVQTLEAFWRVIGEAVNGPGGYFGRNLDALHDCLHGGMGAPEDDDYLFEWRYHDVSRRNLGYTETARQLKIRLGRCHPSNRPGLFGSPVEGATRQEPRRMTPNLPGRATSRGRDPVLSTFTAESSTYGRPADRSISSSDGAAPDPFSRFTG